jgi:hypothetical protein
METKCIVIGEERKNNKKKSIEFLKTLNLNLEFTKSPAESSDYLFIELICLNYDDKNADLMFAYNDLKNRSSGILVIGHWNDGIVE